VSSRLRYVTGVMNAEPDASSQRVGGRPRDGRIDDAILRATAELVVEVGYSHLTIGAVAERAGTTRPALYRRWTTKADLVHEATFPAAQTVIPPAADDLVAEVRGLVETARELFDSALVRAALPGLMAESAIDPALSARVLARFDDLIAVVRDRLNRNAHRGHPGSTLPGDRVIDLIAGAAILRSLLSPNGGLDDAWVDDISALIAHGVTGLIE
jgi:AcrR family transcriptional regulator